MIIIIYSNKHKVLNMTKVSQSKRRVSGRDIIFQCNYSTQKLTFSMKLPSHMSEALCLKDPIEKSTESEVWKELDTLIKQFEKIVFKEEKVIIFNIKAQTPLHAGIGTVYGNTVHSEIRNFDEITQHHELQLSMRYYVVIKKYFDQQEMYFTDDYENRNMSLIGGYHDGKYGWKQSPQQLSIRSSFIEIPWTQEREDFFKTAKVGFINLINTLVKFRNTAEKDSEAFLKFIDSGGNFGFMLPTGKAEAKNEV